MQLYVANMDGSKTRRLTTMFMGVSRPQWSPDGRTIAFLASQKSCRVEQGFNKGWGKEEMMLINPDGTHLRRILSTCEQRETGLSFPAWSTNSRSLTVRADGDKLTVFVDRSHRLPLPLACQALGSTNEWSPSPAQGGSRIAYIVNEGIGGGIGLGIGVASADCSHARILRRATLLESVAWSPDGQQLAFLENGPVWVMNPDGAGRTRITPRGWGESAQGDGVTWARMP